MLSEIVNALVKANDALLTPLRNGTGFSEQAFDDLCEALVRCAREWADADVTPKPAANILVDLFPAVESASYGYPLAEAVRIREAASTLDQLVGNHWC